MCKRFRIWIVFLFIINCIHTDIPAQEPIPLYTKFEVQFDVEMNDANPFFSNEFQVDALIQHEDGSRWTVPCFYDSTRDWKLRFAPMKVGRHSYSIEVKNGSIESHISEGGFDAVPSDSPGFVRVSQQNPRFFSFDNGKSYFPVGQNLCWVNPPQAETWISYLDECEDAGMNWIRIWMVSWGNTELIWSPRNGRYHGMDRYDIKNARMLDDIFAEAEQRGIYIELVINHHGQYSSATNPIWRENPYNIALGGFLRTPQEFFTNETAKQHYRDKLRYLVARYGYSTSLMAWEYWNEVDLTSGYDYQTVYDWHREMSSFLDDIDPYNHLRSTSASGNFDGNYMTDGMDFIQSHNYRTNITGTVSAIAAKAKEDFPDLPHFHGELSYDYRGPNTQDQDGVILHNQLWSSIHSSDAGTAMTWWWDNWVRPNNLYSDFRSIANYISGINWVDNDLQPLEVKISPQPENVVNLSILPVKGWATTVASEFTVYRDGTIDNVDELSSFIHGDYHRDMSPNPIFILNNELQTNFSVHINTIARAGSNLTIRVNEEIQIDHDFAPSNRDYTPDSQTFAVKVPPGMNRVEIINNGLDWFTVDRYRVNNYVERIRAYARGNSTTALVWIHDSLHQYASIYDYRNSSPVQSTEITLPSLGAGEYQVEQFDTYAGQVTSSQILLVSDNRLRFPVLDWNKDTAFRINANASSIEKSSHY